MCSSNDEEDLFDDLILLSCGGVPTSSVTDIQFPDKGSIDLDSSEICETAGYNGTSHPRLESLATRPQVTPYTIKNLKIKLIDCYKYPWYFNKKMENKTYKKLIDGAENNCNIVSEIEDDLDIMYVNTTVNCVLNRPKVEPPKQNSDMVIKQKLKNDLEIHDAIRQSNKMGIDLKRNTGLVGLKIQRSDTKDVSNKLKQMDTNAIDKKLEKDKEGYVGDVDKALLSIGTTITPVFEEPGKKTNEKKQNECKRYKTIKYNNGSNFKTTANVKSTLSKTKDNIIKINTKENVLNETIRTQHNANEIINQLTGGKLEKLPAMKITHRCMSKEYIGKPQCGKNLAESMKEKMINKKNKQSNIKQELKATKLIPPLPSKPRKRGRPSKKPSDTCSSNEYKISTTPVLQDFKYIDRIITINNKGQTKRIVENDQIPHLPSKPRKRGRPSKKPSDTCSSNEYKISTTPVLQDSKYIDRIIPIDNKGQTKRIVENDQISTTSQEKPVLESRSQSKFTENIHESLNSEFSEINSNKNLKKALEDKVTKYNHPLGAIKKLMSAKGASKEKSPPKNRRKQSFDPVSENFRSIEDYMGRVQKPMQVIPKDFTNDKIPIETYGTNPSKLGFTKENYITIHTTSPKPINQFSPIRYGQEFNSPRVTKPLNVINSLQAHVLYRPQNGFQQPMYPNISYQVPSQQQNQSVFIHQKYENLLEPAQNCLPLKAQVVSNVKLPVAEVYDVRSKKVFYPYTYPPSSQPLYPPPKTSKPHEVTNLLSTTQLSDSIIGINKDGVIKKIAITTTSLQNTPDDKEVVVKTENASNSTPLYDEISECSTVTTKMDMLRELDTSCMQRVNTPEKVESLTADDSHKRSCEACQSTDIFSNSDYSRDKLLFTRIDSRCANDLNKVTAESAFRSKSSFLTSENKEKCKNVLFFDSMATNDLIETIPPKISTTTKSSVNMKSIQDFDYGLRANAEGVLHENLSLEEQSEDKRKCSRAIKRTFSNLNTDSEAPLRNPAKTSSPRYKPGPLSKKFKLIDPKPSFDVKDVSCKGYSPPILPIPTYESILPHVLFDRFMNYQSKEIDTRKTKEDTRNESKDTDTRKNKDNSKNECNLKNKLKFERDGHMPKKISLDEYKKRVLKTDALQNTDSKNNNTEMYRRVANVDSDLGYDSDSTVKL